MIANMRNDYRARNHPAWWAFLLHRLSGLALSVFLPFHFWALGQALQGEARLDSLLRWTEQPVVKFAEVTLVLLLALEFLPWRNWQKSLLAVAAGAALAAGLAFALAL